MSLGVERRAGRNSDGQRGSRWLTCGLSWLTVLTLSITLLAVLVSPKAAANPLVDDKPPAPSHECTESKTGICESDGKNKDAFSNSSSAPNYKDNGPPDWRGLAFSVSKGWYEVDPRGRLVPVDPDPTLVASFQVFVGTRPAESFTCSGADENPDLYCHEFTVTHREWWLGIPIVVQELSLDDEWVLLDAWIMYCTGDVCEFHIANVRRDSLERVTQPRFGYTIRLGKRWLESDGRPAEAHPATELELTINGATRLRLHCQAGPGADQMCGTVVVPRQPTSLDVVEPSAPEGWAVIAQGEFTCQEESRLCEGTVVNQRRQTSPGLPVSGDDDLVTSDVSDPEFEWNDPPVTDFAQAGPAGTGQTPPPRPAPSSTEVPAGHESASPAREDVSTTASGSDVIAAGQGQLLPGSEQAHLPQVLPRTGDSSNRLEPWNLVLLTWGIIVVGIGLFLRARTDRWRV